MLLRWLNQINQIDSIHVHITSIIDCYASLHHLLINSDNIDIYLLVSTRIPDFKWKYVLTLEFAWE